MNTIVNFLEKRGFKFIITRVKEVQNKSLSYMTLSERYELTNDNTFTYKRESFTGEQPNDNKIILND